MKETLYVIYFKDGTELEVYAFSREQAIILVQAERIKDGKDYYINVVNEKACSFRRAFINLLDRYVELVNSGDCGSSDWDVEKEQAVIDARKYLKG